MPELPDLAQFKSYIDSTALHQVVERVRVMDERILENITPQQLGQHVTGRSFESTLRHGKYLFAELAGHGWLVLHFGMTGNVASVPADDEPPRFARVVFAFDNGKRLAYLCQRMLGKVGVTESADRYIEQQSQGPDALDETMDRDRFSERVGGRRAAIKRVLMDQSVLAGIGNICADEILFQARMHPKTRVSELDRETLDHVFDTMRATLRTLADCRVHHKALPEHFISDCRDPGCECPRCGGMLERIAVNSRNGYYCPNCQPG